MANIEDSQHINAVGQGIRFQDFFALLKPRVMSLVVFTALVGMILAPGAIDLTIVAIATLSIAVGGGASGALNMWYDADIDVVMSRTKNRPIPSGRVSRNEALLFGLALSVLSVSVLGFATNWLAAGLLAFTIFFYVIVYTVWLKRHTPQNIVIGGAAGAFPPVIGWLAVTGSISLEPLILFLIIFLWTPPHFWALALYKKNDYAAANIPMLPNVAGEKNTRIQIAVYSLLLAFGGFLPVIFGFSGMFYAFVAGVAGLIMISLSARLLPMEGAEMRLHARKLFLFSLSFLFVIFSALLLENLVLRMLDVGV